jgi:outer membrane receptor for ferrienterochelin and colicin
MSHRRNFKNALRSVALGSSALFLGASPIGLPPHILAAEEIRDPGTAANSQSPDKSSQDSTLPDLSLEQLINVKITTASKSEERISDAPGIVSVVTKDELDRFDGMTLKDILERVPGLIGSSVYMTDRSMISIRGDQISNSGEHVLLLINGRPLREVLEGGIKSEMLETFPVGAIQRIEVVKGPGSVLYGSTAFSGVINVITEQPEKNSFTATGYYGEEGAWGASGKATVKLGDLYIMAAAQYLEKADWPINYVSAGPGGNIVDPIDVPNFGGGAYLGANYHDFSVMAAYNDWTTAYFIPDFESIFPPSHGDAHWRKIFSNFGYDTDVNQYWRTSANLTYTRSLFDTSLSAFPGVERDSYEALIEWANFITLSDKSRLTLGGVGTRIEGSEFGNGVQTSKGSRWDAGFYGQVDYQILKSLKVIAGAQANKIENLDWDVVPRGGVIWYPIPQLTFKALYGQAFRAPSINENHLDNPGLVGDPDLKPEHVATIDVGLSYQNDQAEVGVSYFHSALTDIIFQDRTGFPTYANQDGTTTIQGVEVEGKYYITKELFFTGSFIYQTSKDDNGNQNLSPLANYGVKAGISYLSAKGFSASLFNIYQGPLDDKYHSTLNPSPGAYDKLSLHLEWNLSTFFNWKKGPKTSLLVQADNLLDEQIWLPAWGLTPGQSIPYDKGRAIWAGVRATF